MLKSGSSQVSNEQTLAVVIPTLNRGPVLLSTLEMLFEQTRAADEILVVDQSVYSNDDPVLSKLSELHRKQKIKLIQPNIASIPNAMNIGLQQAQAQCVLFLDDDIRVAATFIQDHINAWDANQFCAQVGRIIQPWQTSVDLPESYDSGRGLNQDLEFPFNSTSNTVIKNCMAGNFLVDRERAIQAGGFDTLFEGSAYRFETEFGRRLIRTSGKPMAFTPAPILHHLKLSSGGTRSFEENDFHKTRSHYHSQGDYYFALIEGQTTCETWRYILKRFFTSVVAKFYLFKPWWMPVRLLAEVRGLLKALKRHQLGQNLIQEGTKRRA